MWMKVPPDGMKPTMVDLSKHMTKSLQGDPAEGDVWIIFLVFREIFVRNGPLVESSTSGVTGFNGNVRKKEFDLKMMLKLWCDVDDDGVEDGTLLDAFTDAEDRKGMNKISLFVILFLKKGMLQKIDTIQVVDKKLVLLRQELSGTFQSYR